MSSYALETRIYNGTDSQSRQLEIPFIFVNEVKLNYERQLLTSEMFQVCSSAELFEYISNISDVKAPVESMGVVFLNRANKVMGHAILSLGGITGTVCDTRVLFSLALNCLACSIALWHNHPSGNLRASEADKKLTAKVKEGGTFLDIKLLDHLIVTDIGYYSFADEGEL